jgi:hypothetical protein
LFSFKTSINDNTANTATSASSLTLGATYGSCLSVSLNRKSSMISYSLRLLCFVVFFASCKEFENQTPKEIYGRWALDSTSGRGGKIIAGGPRGHTEFTLQQNKTFVYKWSDFDVFDDYSGTFNYSIIPK